jgi:hypothetical protein
MEFQSPQTSNFEYPISIVEYGPQSKKSQSPTTTTTTTTTKYTQQPTHNQVNSFCLLFLQWMHLEIVQELYSIVPNVLNRPEHWELYKMKVQMMIVVARHVTWWIVVDFVVVVVVLQK